MILIYLFVLTAILRTSFPLTPWAYLRIPPERHTLRVQRQGIFVDAQLITIEIFKPLLHRKNLSSALRKVFSIYSTGKGPQHFSSSDEPKKEQI